MKQHSIRSEKDFKLLFTKGHRLDSRLFRVSVRKNNLGFPRFAFIVPRAVEKRAVLRNRSRRRAREWIRRQQKTFSAALDIALVFKKEAIVSSKKTFYEELRKIFAQILAR